MAAGAPKWLEPCIQTVVAESDELDMVAAVCPESIRATVPASRLRSEFWSTDLGAKLLRFFKLVPAE